MRQLARLYRAAMRIPSFDPMQLQGLCQRLYQKRPEELSMLEVSAMIGTFNAVARGTVDVKHVLAESAFAMNGHAGTAPGLARLAISAARASVTGPRRSGVVFWVLISRDQSLFLAIGVPPRRLH